MLERRPSSDMTAWLLLLVPAGAIGWWAGRRRGLARAREEALETQQVREELGRRLSEVLALRELTYVLTDAQAPELVAEKVTQYVERFVECRGVAVVLTAGRRGYYTVSAARGTLGPALHAEAPLADGTLAAEVLQERQLRRSEDDTASPPAVAGVSAAVGATVGLPLIARETAIGVLLTVEPRAHPFTADALRLLSMVATHAALALATARSLHLVRAARDQWEATFDGLGDGVALLDPDGRVQRANRALALLLGRAPHDVIGIRLDRALFGTPTLERALTAAGAGLQPPPQTVRSDALRRELRFTVAPAPGAEVGWGVVLVEDVTEQRALETRLILSERMAAMGQLVSGVAHELNNPLTSIAGLSEFLLESSPAAPDAREHLAVIREQAERAAHIVRNLLTFARHGPAEQGPVDLNDVATRTAALIRYEVGLHGITFELALASAVPPIRGDRYEIQQIVLNLLTNAVHAVRDLPPDRPRTVRVYTATTDTHVVLRVEDSGPGIAPDLLPRIFEPFTTTKGVGQGTGLGLSIVYHLVEEHGGTIIPSSTERGTTFELRLPAAEPAPTPVPPPSRPSAPRVPTGRQLLLIDPDPGVRRTIETLFTHEGHVVESAADGDGGLARLRDARYDLIIGDARTAVAPGAPLADVLLARYPEYRARIILLTGDVRGETDRWLQRLGVPYFRKPFNIRELRAAVARRLAEAADGA